MHNRKYVPGITDLKIGRVIHDQYLDDQDYIEKLVIDSGMLKEAPFNVVYHQYYYGDKTDLKLKSRINKKDKDIQTKVELDMDILQWADMYNLKLFLEIMMIGALEPLIDLGKKYKLEIGLIEKERKYFREKIPETIKECESIPRMKMEEYPYIRKYFRNDINVCGKCFSAKATPKARQCLVCMEFSDPILIK